MVEGVDDVVAVLAVVLDELEDVDAVLALVDVEEEVLVAVDVVVVVHLHAPALLA